MVALSYLIRAILILFRCCVLELGKAFWILVTNWAIIVNESKPVRGMISNVDKKGGKDKE